MWDVWDLLKVFTPTVRPETQVKLDELRLVKIFGTIDTALNESIGIDIFDGGLGFKESWTMFKRKDACENSDERSASPKKIRSGLHRTPR